MAPMSPVPAARSVSSRMRNFSPAVNVRRLGRFDNSGLAAAGAGTTVGLRPSSVPAPAPACASATLLGMTTRQFSYALKSKLLGGLCLIIIGTEGTRTSSFPRVSRWRLCHSKEPSARDRKMRDFCQGFRALGSMDRDLVWLYCVIEDVVRQILGETRLRSRGPTPELTDVESLTIEIF